MVCTEFVIFPASNALLSDPSVFNDSVNLILASRGSLDAYSGVQLEDQKTAYLAIGWETIDHHKALVASSSHLAVKSAFQILLGGPLTVRHIHFSADTSRAFNAPVTEITTVVLRKGKSKERLKDILSHACAAASRLNPQYSPCVFGELVEQPGTFYHMAGWDSVEAIALMHAPAVPLPNARPLSLTSLVQAHMETLVRSEVIATLWGSIKDLAEVTVRHVELSKHIKSKAKA